MKLNIPQLNFAKLAQSRRHQSGSQEVPGAILTGGNFLGGDLIIYGHILLTFSPVITGYFDGYDY